MPKKDTKEKQEEIVTKHLKHAEISYTNKDIISKSFSEKFRSKSLNMYGLNLPEIVSLLPTNLPEFTANEMRIDNLFLFADNSIGIVDYESDQKPEDRNKYLNYLTRVLSRFEKEKIFDVNLRMIVIYTADIKRKDVIQVHNLGAINLRLDCAFLSEIDNEELSRRLNWKIKNNEPLTDEDIMGLIVLPLTYTGKEAKKKVLNDTITLAKYIKDEELMTFILSGIVVFADKVIEENMIKNVKEWISMTKLGRLYEEEKQNEIAKIIAEKDALMANTIAEKDDEIKRLREELEKARAAK